MQRRKQAQIDELLDEAVTQISKLPDREFFVAGVALYAGEGAKGDGDLKMANTNPRIIAFSAPGCGASTTLMKVAYVFGSTSTIASTSTRRSGTGPH